MRVTWSATQGGGHRVKFVGAKKRSSAGEELITLIASAVAKAMKITKKSNVKDTFDSENDTEA